jgi:hypothetical protein
MIMEIVFLVQLIAQVVWILMFLMITMNVFPLLLPHHHVIQTMDTSCCQTVLAALVTTLALPVLEFLPTTV